MLHLLTLIARCRCLVAITVFITSSTRTLRLCSSYTCTRILGYAVLARTSCGEPKRCQSESCARSRIQIVSLKRRSVIKRRRSSHWGLVEHSVKDFTRYHRSTHSARRSGNSAVDIRAQISTTGVPCCSRVGSRMNSLPCGLPFVQVCPLFLAAGPSLVVQHDVHNNKVIGTICYFKCSNVTKLMVHIGYFFSFLYGLNPYSRNADARPLPDDRHSTLCRDIRPVPDP